MFGINKASHEVFRKNFLHSVSVGVSFKEEPECTKLKERFINLYNDDMPKSSETDGIKIKMMMSRGSLKYDDNLEHDKGVVLRSANMKSNISLSKTDCKYTTSADDYVGSEQLEKIFKKAVGYLEVCGVKKFNELTVRKLNILQFKIESKDDNPVPVNLPLSQIISEKFLLPNQSVGSINKFMRQAMQTIRLQDNGYELTIKYGCEILNKNDHMTVVDGIVVLDLTIKRINVALSDYEDVIRKENEELFNAFVWAISKNTLENLRNG